jgi:uncharacterized membrane protein YeaQ/YmgE (transglycosylase-associated protein family)
MEFASFLIVGVFSGWIASTLVSCRGIGLLTNILIGVTGAFAGGAGFKSLGITSYGFFGPIGMSATGAILFLFLTGLFNKERYRSKMHS